MQPTLITPESHPDDRVVGRHFGGYGCASAGNQTAIYYCDSYDPRIGYWMANVFDPTDRKNVSERAIGATFWPADDEGEYWWICQWKVKVSKTGERMPLYGEPGWTPRTIPTSETPQPAPVLAGSQDDDSRSKS